MKKLLLVLGMITCIFGLTACGAAVEEGNEYGVSDEQIIQYADSLIDTMNQIVITGQKEQYASDAVLYQALESFSAALTDMGDYQSVIDHKIEYNKGILINVDIQGALRKATVEIILDKELMLSSITTNVTYSFGEMMAKAGLNTLMGMGTVFAVLILISWLISSFALIPKIQESFSKDKKKDNGATKAVEQIVKNETANQEVIEEADDLELVAVIAAAIAAYEGNGSADGYVVRSIKRRR